MVVSLVPPHVLDVSALLGFLGQDGVDVVGSSDNLSPEFEGFLDYKTVQYGSKITLKKVLLRPSMQ